MYHEPIHIFSDVDGVLTVGQKIWNGAGHKEDIGKMFSDKDSWILNKFKHAITLISNDCRITEQRAKDNDWNFVYVPEEIDKIVVLQNIRKKMGIAKYVYVGDGMPDFPCLLNATLGFVPMDCSRLLLNYLKDCTHITILPVRGGDGVLDSVVYELIERKLWERPLW